jgi:phage terminase small subunit
MRKHRTSDTTGGAVSMLRDALEGPPQPPAELREDAHRHWFAIVEARPSSDWAPLQLILAELAALALADIEDIQRVLDAEGLVIATPAGGKAHPAVSILDGANKRLLSLLRSMGVGVDNSRDSRARSEEYRRSRVIAGQ